jgi:hypothetical protein
MDRRTFLTGVLGLAGAAAIATTARPVNAIAGVPNPRGILDELDASTADIGDDGGKAEVELANHRRGHWHHPRRRHRKHVWRNVCRRYWHHGRWHRRCYRRRVWVWYYR